MSTLLQRRFHSQRRKRGSTEAIWDSTTRKGSGWVGGQACVQVSDNPRAGETGWEGGSHLAFSSFWVRCADYLSPFPSLLSFCLASLAGFAILLSLSDCFLGKEGDYKSKSKSKNRSLGISDRTSRVARPAACFAFCAALRCCCCATLASIERAFLLCCISSFGAWYIASSGCWPAGSLMLSMACFRASNCRSGGLSVWHFCKRVWFGHNGVGLFAADMIAMVNLPGVGKGAIAMAGRVMTIKLVELPSPAVSVEPSHSVPFSHELCVAISRPITCRVTGIFTAHQGFTRCSGLGARPINYFG